MIIVYFNKPDYEYDVHSLIKAFFPKEDVELYYTCPEEEVADRNVACMHREAGELDETTKQEADHVLEVNYKEAQIELNWYGTKKSRAEFPVDYEDRSATKNALKQHLYDMLVELCEIGRAHV